MLRWHAESRRAREMRAPSIASFTSFCAVPVLSTAMGDSEVNLADYSSADVTLEQGDMRHSIFLWFVHG